MNPVRPEELSALVDGELNPEREREVRAALAESLELRSQFDALSRLDRAWRTAASGAAFDPRVKPIPSAELPWVRTLCLVAMLVFVRLALKWVDTEAIVWIANAAVFVAVMTVIVRLVRRGDVEGDGVRA